MGLDAEVALETERTVRRGRAIVRLSMARPQPVALSPLLSG
ncbi:hypothetical protein [Baaleninema simplex]|nr:hypothetical protein [Baaleninema simplex]